MHTRPDIDAELARLQERLPQLVEQLPADEVLLRLRAKPGHSTSAFRRNTAPTSPAA